MLLCLHQPSPAPSPTFSGAVTDTVTGAPIAGFSALLNGSRVTVSAPGYLTRETRNGNVDLIPEAAPFSLAFYRQFVRNGFEAPGNLEPLRRLTVAPSIYLQTAGLSPSTVTALEHAARQAVYDFSGQTMGVVSFEMGEALPADRSGWITVELVNDAAVNCGRSFIGAPIGHVSLNLASRCNFATFGTTALAHEIGHALGFWHVEDSGALMFASATATAASPLERYHGELYT